MTNITRDQVETLNLIALDISNARRTARLAGEDGQSLSTEQFMLQQRQLDRALEALAEYRETLAVADADVVNAVISIAAVAA